MLADVLQEPLPFPPGVDTGALSRYLQMSASPLFGLRAAPGFAAGFADGFLNGGRVWRDELIGGLRVVGVGTTAALTEFFVRPLLEDSPQGLLPQTRAAVDGLNSIRTLRPVFLWLDRTGPDEIIEQLAELMPSASELAIIIGRATTAWLNGLLRTAPSADAAGRYLGRLVGRAVLELIRAVCEPDALMTLTAAGGLEAGGPEMGASDMAGSEMGGPP